MSYLCITFWLCALATCLWCVAIFVLSSVREFYFPMAANGDLFHPLRTWAFLLPVLIILIAIGSFVLRRPLSKRFYWVSLFVIVVAALLPLLPNVDNGYKQAYWIGDDMYSIPWRYAPYNGKDAPGGKSFVIQLKPTSLKPLHSSDEGGVITVMVSSATSVFDAQPLFVF